MAFLTAADVATSMWVVPALITTADLRDRDSGKALDGGEVNDVAGRRQALLHGGQKRVPARHVAAALGFLEQCHGGVDGCGAMIIEVFHFLSPYSAARFMGCMAFHTVSGVAGMAMSRTPMALVMALITAGGAAMAPASPQPFMPNGLDGHLVIGEAQLEVFDMRHVAGLAACCSPCRNR